MNFLDIGEVARRSGIKPSALRYYEEIGLIAPVSRHGLRRQYAPEVLLQLQLIALGQMGGFSLDEIATMFGPDGKPELPRAVLHKKVEAIDSQIVRLKMLRETLRHVADCPAPSHLECPTFRRLLETGTTGRRGRAMRTTSRKTFGG